MRVVRSLDELRQIRARLVGKLGFVPTMGALHEGHKELMRTARPAVDHLLVSIYVNPTQFAPNEDLEQYPRTPEQDLAHCLEVGVDFVWFPTTQDIYPPGSQTFVEVDILGKSFEGESRPHHFRGVATVVTKLFNAVKPDSAYFGEKDLQQLHLIKRMARDLLCDIEIIGVPTARDENGLALSSRNRYLSPEQRREAAGIRNSLKELATAFELGAIDPRELRATFEETLGQGNFEVEQFDLVDSQLTRSFKEGESFPGGYCAVAVRFCGVRLIDNIQLTRS